MATDCLELTEKEARQLSQEIVDGISSHDYTLRKKAEETINEFTRLRLRETAFTPVIMPPQKITNDQFDRQLHTSLPVKIVDMEPDSPASISVPLGSTPMQFNINANRYAVYFDRILSPKYYADVDTLLTWYMDIRTVIGDNSVKDMGTELDTKFIAAVDSALVGEGVPNATTGAIQYKNLNAPITRDSLADSTMVMPDSPFALEAETYLTNHITIKHFMKLDRTEMGGDLAQEVLKKGVSVLDGLLDKRWVVTIKKALVPNGHVYQFAKKKFLGKHFQVEDTTMSMKRDAFMLEFWSYMFSGLTIGNTAGVAHVVFQV